MANKGRNAMANIMGTVKRMDAPQRVMMKQVRMTTEGMEMIIVVV